MGALTSKKKTKETELEIKKAWEDFFEPIPEQKARKVSNNFNEQLQEAVLRSNEDQKTIDRLRTTKKKYLVDWGLRRIPFVSHLAAFKLVRIVEKGELKLDVAAIVELRIGTMIRTGVGGQVIKAENLKNGEKYCVPDAMVVGVRFISKDVSLITQTVESFLEGKVKCVSNYDRDFEYPLGSRVGEPKFGHPGEGCIQGIHCFLNLEDAAKYTLTGFTGINCHQFPVITTKFENYDTMIDPKPAQPSSVRPPIERVQREEISEEIINKLRDFYRQAFEEKSLISV